MTSSIRCAEICNGLPPENWQRTASGQSFDSNGHTAAHRTLPFGSRVTLRNPQDVNSVTAVINDRGPFTRGGTLDLSRSAARAIGHAR
ncbi:septal ring lytic transglycosylase RlpA family protein [Bradyrhizobium sp. 1050_B9_N1_2]|uniref:septal ring lytic transglycosylase RlpA family protein n=1 Tax=Bradyrhizobium sp. 1050_B9_N1_2 TaxID=3238688 RepID=UPI003EDC7F3F